MLEKALWEDAEPQLQVHWKVLGFLKSDDVISYIIYLEIDILCQD